MHIYNDTSIYNLCKLPDYYIEQLPAFQGFIYNYKLHYFFSQNWRNRAVEGTLGGQEKGLKVLQDHP